MIKKFKKATIRYAVVAAIAILIACTALTNAKPAIAQNIKVTAAASENESIILPQNSKDVATLWAEALSQRDGGLRFSLLSKELKELEITEYEDIRWTIGGSSPWVVSYTVEEADKQDNDTYEYLINYVMTDSGRGKYNSQDNVTVKKFGSNWYVTKHDDYMYMPEVIENGSVPFSKVEPRKSSSLISKDSEGAVTLWAEALKHRNGAARYSILSSELKNQEFEKYSKMNWVIGGSSPWVTSYDIKQLNKIDENTYEYEIYYTMTDSTKAIYTSKENVTVKKLRNWVITKHDDYDFLPEITK